MIDIDLLYDGNKRFMDYTEYCKPCVAEVNKIEVFIDQILYLTFGREFIGNGQFLINLSRIIKSAGLTLGSIRSCCEHACIADANTLARKYRDDLFFYLYLKVYYDNWIQKMEDKNISINEAERHIENWIHNEMKNLKIKKVLSTIFENSSVKEAAGIYNLDNILSDMGQRLNNYVHGNGISFYNYNANAYQTGQLEEELKSIISDLKYFTVCFLFLLILISPHSIMADDYMDYMDNGVESPEGSEKWVAPFVETFIKENIDIIDQGCLTYLRENTSMDI